VGRTLSWWQGLAALAKGIQGSASLTHLDLEGKVSPHLGWESRHLESTLKASARLVLEASEGGRAHPIAACRVATL
jgi:hypothetical protein